VIIAAGVAIVGLAWSTFRYRDMYFKTADELRKTEFRRRALEEDASNFRSLGSDSAAMLQIMPTLTIAEVKTFQDDGLWNPYDDIANDLMNHPELVEPDSAVWGDTPVLAREDICVLGPDRVLAHLEHGDYLRRVLLSYTVSQKGDIDWKVLEAVGVE